MVAGRITMPRTDFNRSAALRALPPIDQILRDARYAEVPRAGLARANAA